MTQKLTNLVAFIGVVENPYLTGGAKRKFPTGGLANGIPKYADTPLLTEEALPRTLPIVVFTGAPNFAIGAAAASRPWIEPATASEAKHERTRVEKSFMSVSFLKRW